MASEEPYEPIGWAVARLARQVELALATVDVSSAQYRMLVQLARGAEASTSLAEKLAVSGPSVTAVVEGLVQRGAVERSRSVEDRRQISLALTETGCALLASAEDAVRGRLQSIADELGSEPLVTMAVASLGVWGEALDRARIRRQALLRSN